MSLKDTLKKFWLAIIVIVVLNAFLMNFLVSIMQKHNVNEIIQIVVMIFGNVAFLCIFSIIAVLIYKSFKSKSN